MGSAALRAEPVLQRPGSLSGLGRSLLRRRECARGVVRPVWGRRLWRWMEQSLALRRAMPATVVDERQGKNCTIGAVADQDVLGGHPQHRRNAAPARGTSAAAARACSPQEHPKA
jgi:hypothetical protein